MLQLQTVRAAQSLAACGRPAWCSICFLAVRCQGAGRPVRSAAIAFAEADDRQDAWQGSQQDLREMWDSVPRPLLRVGKAGGHLHASNCKCPSTRTERPSTLFNQAVPTPSRGWKHCLC